MKTRQTFLTSTTFQNNQLIEHIDCNNVVWKGNSISYAFAECSNLKSISNINNNVSIVSYAYKNCSNLSTPPTLPNSVTNIEGVYQGCSSLTDIPHIPDSVTNMSYTFAECTNIKKLSTLPNSVSNMSYTFRNCLNLSSVSYTFDNVYNMEGTFQNCIRLNGDIQIISEKIGNANLCFDNSGTSTKNVYIPFNSTKRHLYCYSRNIEDYGFEKYYIDVYPINLYGTQLPAYDDNGINTGYTFWFTSKDINRPLLGKPSSDGIGTTYSGITRDIKNDTYVNLDEPIPTITYNSFINAGYKTDGSLDNVYLKDFTELVAQGYTITNTESTVYLNTYIGIETNIITPKYSWVQ